MVSALLHDIGKTVVDPRHGLEGRLIIGFHTTKAVSLINEILKSSPKQKDNPTKFCRNDLLFIGQFVNFHDCFGTLSTGEDCYQQLVDIIDVIRRHSLNDNVIKDTEYNADKQYLFNWSQRNLFDLWLLNLADIMVSVKDKWLLHKANVSKDFEISSDFAVPNEHISLGINWWDKDVAESHIRAFFKIKPDQPLDISKNTDEVQITNEFFKNLNKGNILIHDLKIAFELLYSHNQKIHADDVKTLQQKALDYSIDHTVERLRRLLFVSLHRAINKFKNKEKEKEEWIKSFITFTSPDEGANKIIEDIRKQYNKEIYKILEILEYDLTKSQLNYSIVRSIKSSGNFQNFAEKLATIGKMDYSLGFFIKIAERAIEKISEEIVTSIIFNKGADNLKLRAMVKRTGWITTKRPEDEGMEGEDYYQVQAEAFADNYATLVTSILNYLVSKYDSITGVKNLEFNDASQRLTEEKIDKMIDLEGAFRSRRAIELILQTISIY